MNQIEAIEMMRGDVFFDGMNKPHRIIECAGNCDHIIPGGISFLVGTDRNQFFEIFYRHERLHVMRPKITSV